jgi:hypothetical protein
LNNNFLGSYENRKIKEGSFMAVNRTTVLRTIGDLRYFIRKGHVAFYLGAGVDMQLTHDAGMAKSPDWRNMLLDLNFHNGEEQENNIFSESDPQESQLWNDYVEKWPAEIAALARWKYGDKEFTQLIADLIEDKTFEPKIKGTTKALCDLLSHSNIIFTTNYADYITKAMKVYNPSTEYIVLDREDLDGFVFPEPAPRKEIQTVYIVHIHGRPTSRSFPILDAWGYNIAQSDDPSYIKLLEALFKNRHVITIGTSWSDVPLRNITGYLNRKFPYLGRSHLALLYESELPKKKEQVLLRTQWSNAMSAIYGVDFYFVDSHTQANAIESIISKLDMPDNVDSLQDVADFLDSTGDYESQLQHMWFVNLGLNKFPQLSEQKAAKVGVGMLVDKLYPLLRSNYLSDWIIAARIERHLRHQIWLYPPPSKDVKQLREEIWGSLFRGFKKNYEKLKSADNHLLFDFLTGVYEIADSSLGEIPESLDNVLKERLRAAKHIWKPIPLKENLIELVNDLDALETLAMRLLSLGWESMSAKIITDKAFLMARGMIRFEADMQKMESLPPFGYYDIISDAKRAEGIARVTGCFRRRTKVDVLDALWNKDPMRARNRLLAQLQSGTYGSSSMRIEPAMRSAIGIGLVVNQFRFDESGFRAHKVYDIARNTLEEAGINPNDALNLGNVKYWGRVVPSEMKDKYQSLQREIANVT